MLATSHFIENPHRLPRHVIPSRYRLRFEPDLKNFTFIGSAEIDIEISDPNREIQLNAIDLNITSATLIQADREIRLSTSYIEEKQRISLTTFEDYQPGAAKIRLRFTGTLNDQLHGFYRSTFTDVEGNDRVLATTQFEATDARRAFPCWDEPDFKAQFSITLVVDSELMAVSNAGVVSETILADGRKEIVYAETIPMSTYLVALVVGPLEATEAVDAAGTPLRVITPLGKLDQAQYAIECGVFSLSYFQDYYRIPYPGDKLDMVAIPDFSYGAMENLGCVTYREAALLLDPKVATTNEQIRVLDVVAHELAHMWFGDLVTMGWWEGIWLNEAFASFMEMKAADAMRPEWKRWLQFGAFDRPWAYRVDSLANTRPVEFEVRSPEEADEMFDALTYGKGSSVLRMLEQFIGEESFRSGVENYLKKHSYSNTVTADLWSSLKEEAQWEVDTIMDSWIYQGGFPSVEVGITETGLRLSQRRFLTLPDETDDTLWQIPLQVRGEAQGKQFELKQVFATPEIDLEFEETPDWVVANMGGHGFYRVDYSRPLLDKLQSRLTDLADLERFTLIDDAWAFVDNGSKSVSDYLDFVQSYSGEAEPSIWQTILEALGFINHHLVTEQTKEAFQAQVASLLSELIADLGWEPHPDDSDRRRLLRGMLLGTMARVVRQPEAIERMGSLYEQWLTSPTSLDPDLAQAAISSAATHGDSARYRQMFEAYKTTTDPQDQMRFLRALTLFDNIESVERTFKQVTMGEIRNQDTSWVMAGLLRGKESGPRAWELTHQHWNRVLESMPVITVKRMVEGFPALSRPEVATEVQAFLAETEIPNSEKATSQALERLRANIGLRENQTPVLAEYLSG